MTKYTDAEKAKVIDGKTVEIYALSDETGVRYIGKANNAKRRYSSHMRDCRRRKTPVYNWINKCLARGFSPVLSVLAVVPMGEWQQYERSFIADYRRNGAKLLNVADGGDQPFCSAGTRSNNARLINAKIGADPRLTRLRYLKQRIAKNIKAGFLDSDCAEKLRIAAQKRPDLFGDWLNIQPTVKNAQVADVFN